MLDISQYLEKFKKTILSRDFLITSTVESVKEICFFEIDVKKIVVKNCVLVINEKPIIKTEIFLKKEKILESLNKKVGDKIKDII